MSYQYPPKIQNRESKKKLPTVNRQGKDGAG
jgi:hypothetical protein